MRQAALIGSEGCQSGVLVLRPPVFQPGRQRRAGAVATRSRALQSGRCWRGAGEDAPLLSRCRCLPSRAGRAPCAMEPGLPPAGCRLWASCA